MIEPKYKVGDRVRIIAIGDLYTGLAGTVRDWKRHNKPRRYHYTLDIDGHTGKYGAGPYAENEFEAAPGEPTAAEKIALYDALAAYLVAARAVVAAARAWREAVETLDGVYNAEQALIGALKTCEKAKASGHGTADVPLV